MESDTPREFSGEVALCSGSEHEMKCKSQCYYSSHCADPWAAGAIGRHDYPGPRSDYFFFFYVHSSTLAYLNNYPSCIREASIGKAKNTTCDVQFGISYKD